MEFHRHVSFLYQTNNIQELCRLYKTNKKQMEGFIVENGNTIPYPPKTFLKNKGNSCAIDSILYILFFTNRSYFMNIILNNPGEPDNLFKDSKEFRQEILPLIRDLYGNHNRWSNYADKIQIVISKYLKDSDGCYDIKSGTEIWSLFAFAFDNLQFVFNNGLNRGIYLHDYPKDVTRGHIVVGDDEKPRNRQIPYPKENLVAVLFYLPGHYTCAIKNDKKWYYYNDLSSNIVEIDEQFIFTETVNKKPQLFFYIL